jgi:hypothetical protein
MAACGDNGDAFETQGDAILRPTANGGRNEVVMIYGTLTNGGRILCSGSYFAPRVVLTAAHCIPANVYQLFAYWGDDYPTDLAELTPDGIGLIPPPIGAPSHWAQADSWQINPARDPAKNSADMAVVFLDRKPPFDPLPLYRNRVNANVPVTITGWGSNSTPTPITGAGYGVQRTGRSVTLGTPTAADYHPDDPNPAMLDAAVRQQYIKTDARAPYSSGCFGDSGGPIIVNQYGQDYVAGVSSWTGLSCEDYNLLTRLDPFLPFLDLSYKRGGQDLMKPTFSCVTPNPSGSLTAVFGYRNDNGVGIAIPYGSKNALARDTAGFRPTRFKPGTHAQSFGVDFTSGQTVSWTLSPDNNPITTLTASSSSPRCAVGTAETNAVLTCRAVKRSGCADVGTYEACIESTADTNRTFAQLFPLCIDEWNAAGSCTAGTPPGAANWSCYEGGADSNLCNAEFDAFINCYFDNYYY